MRSIFIGGMIWLWSIFIRLFLMHLLAHARMALRHVIIIAFAMIIDLKISDGIHALATFLTSARMAHPDVARKTIRPNLILPKFLK